MSNYRYEAVEAASGRRRQGQIAGSSTEAAVQALRAQGLHPINLTLEEASAGGSGGEPGRAGWRDRFSRRPSAQALAVFTRQLATLIRARLPLLRALEVLERQERPGALRRAIGSLAETIRGGGSLSDGLRQHPTLFPSVFVHMTRAGEASGALGDVLGRVATFLEKQARLRRRIRAAMTYPMVISGVAVAIVSALMIFVIPRFELIFRGLLKGQPLPPLTRVVMGTSRFVQEHLVLTTLGVVGIFLAAGALRRVSAVARAGDWLGLRVPVLGDLNLKASVARFTRTWGTLLISGVPILEALRITRDTSGNSVIGSALDRVHDEVQAGQNVAPPLEQCRLFPPMVTSMIAVGEETGGLPEMLNRVADIYEEEVDQAVGGLIALLEPLMIVVMALIVGTIVIALFLPIIRIIQLLS